MTLLPLKRKWTCQRCGKRYKSVWGMRHVTEKRTGKRKSGIFCPDCIETLKS